MDVSDEHLRAENDHHDQHDTPGHGVRNKACGTDCALNHYTFGTGSVLPPWHRATAQLQQQCCKGSERCHGGHATPALCLGPARMAGGAGASHVHADERAMCVALHEQRSQPTVAVHWGPPRFCTRSAMSGRDSCNPRARHMREQNHDGQADVGTHMPLFPGHARATVQPSGGAHVCF